jgi:hypothetical protein
MTLADVMDGTTMVKLAVLALCLLIPSILKRWTDKGATSVAADINAGASQSQTNDKFKFSRGAVTCILRCLVRWCESSSLWPHQCRYPPPAVFVSRAVRPLLQRWRRQRHLCFCPRCWRLQVDPWPP